MYNESYSVLIPKADHNHQNQNSGCTQPLMGLGESG